MVYNTAEIAKIINRCVSIDGLYKATALINLVMIDNNDSRCKKVLVMYAALREKELIKSNKTNQ